MVQADKTVAHINGIPTATLIMGDGIPLVLLHGWGVSLDLVLPLAQRLVPLGYRCYLLDAPGFGATPPPPAAWIVNDYAQFVVQALNHWQIERAHLFGHSFGGRLGLVLGAEYPQRINKMVLADSAGIRPAVAPAAVLRTRLYKTIRTVLATIGAKHLSEQLRLAYNNRYGSSDFNATSGIMRQTFVHVINQDLLAYARRVTAPTLLIWGANDQDTPLWMGQKLEKEMPDAGLVVHPDAGHYSYLDKLEDTVRIMDYFFKN